MPTFLRLRALMALAVLVSFGLSGCSLFYQDNIETIGYVSPKTGANYAEAIGESAEPFVPTTWDGALTGPGLVFIEGGTFVMGGSEEMIAHQMDNRQRQLTVNSFYMDETEVSNVDYKEFLHYIRNDSGEDKYFELLPDTLVWYRDLSFNDPYVQYYFRHAGFNTYPVVGVTWYQASEYCVWRTEAVNAEHLKRYYPELDPSEVDISVLYPDYRLPTEAEWEYAARGLLEQELYPWLGRNLRNMQGRFYANFKRGRGDYAGRSDKGGSTLIEGLNDGYMIPGPVRAYYPNDFGLYNMAGNVAEWTLDTYRKMAYEDVNDLNPYRRKGKIDDPKLRTLQEDVSYRKGNSLLFNPDPLGNEDMSEETKVYRGGSWADVAYYISVGTRRWSHADSALSTVGFRSAMFRVGRPF